MYYIKKMLNSILDMVSTMILDESRWCEILGPIEQNSKHKYIM